MKNYLFIICCVSLLISCKPEDTQRLQLVLNFGDYAALAETSACEDGVDWFDDQLNDDTLCTLAFSGQELQHHLELVSQRSGWITASKSPDSSPDPQPQLQMIIISQDTPESYAGFNIPPSFLSQALDKQAYWIKFYQQDNQPRLLIMGGDRVGALYGVYALLEHLGVRWYAPGETGRVLPDTLTEDFTHIDIKGAPAFYTRGFWAKDDRGHTDFFDWMARNRINLWSYGQPEKAALKKRGINFLTGGHQIQQRFLNAHHRFPYSPSSQVYPQSKQSPGDINKDGVLSYSEAHPEWFGVKNGQRDFDMRYKYGTNFCTSNDSAVKELAKNFIDDLAQGKWSKADMINFWMSDVGHWCECESCRALGSPTDRMLLLVHQVREAMNQARSEGRLKRDIILTAPAYLETRKAPTRALPDSFDYARNIMTFFPIERCYAHAFNDAQCSDINHHHNQDMLSWMAGEQRHYKGTLFFGEYYNISLLASLPVIFTKVMSADLPYYHQQGIRHMHYMHAETHNWGTMVLTNYLFAKLLWNPQLDVTASLNELYARFYGEAAAETMKAFYTHLENAMSSMKTIRWAGKSFTESYSLDKQLNIDSSELFKNPHLQYNTTHYEHNDGRDIQQMLEDIQQARKALDYARTQASGAAYLARLDVVEQRFAYGEAMVYFYDYLIQTHQAHHRQQYDKARIAFKQLAHYAEKLKAMTEVIKVVGGTLKAGDGFTATFNTESYERYRKLYGSPSPVRH